MQHIEHFPAQSFLDFSLHISENYTSLVNISRANPVWSKAISNIESIRDSIVVI